MNTVDGGEMQVGKDTEINATQIPTSASVMAQNEGQGYSKSRVDPGAEKFA